MRLFASSHLSLKHKAGMPIFTPAKAMKSGAGSSAGTAAHSLPWVDAAQEGLQWGAEEARLALGGEGRTEVSATEVAMAPPTLSTEAIPDPSVEGPRVADAALAAVS